MNPLTFCITPFLIGIISVSPLTPKWRDLDSAVWNPRFLAALSKPHPPILRRVTLLADPSRDRPARSFARLEARTSFRGEWRTEFHLQNTHRSRTLKVKVSRLTAGPGVWPVMESAYYVLGPMEAENLGSVGQSFQTVGRPQIEGAWFAD